jgi:hypothetical protein
MACLEKAFSRGVEGEDRMSNPGCCDGHYVFRSLIICPVVMGALVYQSSRNGIEDRFLFT